MPAAEPELEPAEDEDGELPVEAGAEGADSVLGGELLSIPNWVSPC